MSLSAVIESSHATIPMVGGRPGSVRPDSGNMPGWREEVDEVYKTGKIIENIFYTVKFQKFHVNCSRPNLYLAEPKNVVLSKKEYTCAS